MTTPASPEWLDAVRPLLLEGRTDAVLALLDQAIHAAPDDALAHVVKGDLLRDLGRLAEAEAAFAKALALARGTAPYWLKYAGIHYRRFQIDSALGYPVRVMSAAFG
jgi:tetratricopeptide (TPR) repeat protein